MIRRLLGDWPLRRWIAVISLTPLLAATLIVMAGEPLGGFSAGWFAPTSLAAILAAGVLGS